MAKHRHPRNRPNPGQPEPRPNRLTLDYAHQAVLLDAAVSGYFNVVRELGDDFLLKLVQRPLASEGSAAPRHGDRLVAYSFWEMFSGFQGGGYTVAKAPNGHDALDAFAQFCDPGIDGLPQGVPDQLWADTALIAQLGSFKDIVGELGVGVYKSFPASAGFPYQSRQAFERGFFMQAVNQDANGEITLSELNARYAAYLARINGHKSRWNPALTKRRAWQQSADERARRGHPVRPWPDNALQTLCKAVRRRVDRQGYTQFDGQDVHCEGVTPLSWVVLYFDPFEPAQLRWRYLEAGTPPGTGPSCISALPGLPRTGRHIDRSPHSKRHSDSGNRLGSAFGQAGPEADPG